MSLDDIEVALQGYANEIENLQVTLQKSHRRLNQFFDEHNTVLSNEWRLQANASMEELDAIESTVNEQLLVDLRDATQFRLSTLRRFLHE